MAAIQFRLRPAGAEHNGKLVSYERLRRAMENDEVGELDEVQLVGETEWLPISEHPVAGELVPRPSRGFFRMTEDAGSDMTPMIDVTFQLLIFFMIAASYTIQKTLDLPSTKPKPGTVGAVTMKELEQEHIVVLVHADGTVTVNDQPTAVDGLASALQEAARNRKSAELILDVDDQAVHDVVVKVLDAAGSANIEKVLFVSRVES